jgi:GTP-binding protein HflX
VGFIRKLPPAIISAFKATLEELSEASLLVHVVDLTSRNAAEQCQVVEEILADLKLMEKPRITALNKIDRLLPSGREWDEERVLKYLAGRVPGDEDTVLVSAVKGWGLDRLLELVGDALNPLKNPPQK